MSKESRFLITTEDEDTWKFDRPVIFLAEWCRRYDRKIKWKNLNYIDAKPYGTDPLQQDLDYKEVLKLEKKLFPEICELLNKYHNKKLSIKLWYIICGWAFKSLISQLFYRIKALKNCIENHNISGTTSYLHDNYTITPNFFSDINSDILFSNSNSNIFNIQIINLLENINFPIEYIKKKDLDSISQNQSSNEYRTNLNTQITSILVNLYKNLSKKFIKNNDALILNTYLSNLEELKLEISLGQVPQLFKINKDKINLYPQLLSLKTDIEKRYELIKSFENNSSNYLERIIRKLFFCVWPKIYLEGFDELNKIVNSQNWPKSPKFIFTSNDYYNNEIFKLWTALKVQKGAKYFVGQHGNDHVMFRHRSPTVEEIAADKIITWGYSNSSSKFVPAFIFKNNKIKKKIDHKGGLLLIERAYTKNLQTYDDKFFYLQYLNDQLKFVQHLNEDPRKKITIRLNPEILNIKWAIKKRWTDFDPNINLENGILKIDKLIAKNRLVVHSYNSTGILETLAQNIPTLAFWLNGYDQLNDDAKPYFKLLFDAGILHFSAKSVAEKVNHIWENTESWWASDNIQSARKNFCDRYSRQTTNRISKLTKLLLS